MNKLKNVRLTEGIFKDAQDIGKKYILDLDPNRLLAPCMEAMGQTPKAARYGGWEQRDIAGHSLGHWLSAASYMYRETGDETLAECVLYAAAELARIQDSKGYVGGVKRTVFDKVFSGDFTAERFALNGVWVPWYSVHKIYQGLIDAYLQAGVQSALDVVVGMADWAAQGVLNMTDEQVERMLYCEHGGMNEVFAELYEITGKQEYLHAAERFTDKSVLSPLCCGHDELEGLHANTQLPKIIGAERIGTEEYICAAKFFFDAVTRSRSYVIGGNSNGEHFEKSGAETLGVQTCETCNTYNMLKLAARLFERSHDSRYMDYYEHALCNHILASQDPDSGMKSYFMPTDAGRFKVYCTPHDSFWCCTGTGMENPARYGENIYSTDGENLYVNLFIASEAEYRGIRLSQTTEFPVKPLSRLTIEDGKGELTVKVRVPSWSAGGVCVSVNGEAAENVENGYIKINRQWKKGDTVDISFNMQLSVREKKDDPHCVSFLYGPVVLAAELGADNFPESDIQADHVALDAHPCVAPKAIVTEETDVLKLIECISLDELAFSLNTGLERLVLCPYYALHHQRYQLYFNVYTHDEYERAQLEEQDKKEREQAVIDRVCPGEQQSEVDHGMTGANMHAGYLAAAGSHYRYALGEGGYIEYTVNITGASAVKIICWGGDDDFCMYADTYCREFDILLKDEKIGECSLHKERDGELFEIVFPIEKHRDGFAVLRIQTHGKHTCAGGVFGIEII